MSTVTSDVTLASTTLTSRADAGAERLPFRFDGMLIAAGGSIVLWGGIGTAIWAVANVLF